MSKYQLLQEQMQEQMQKQLQEQIDKFFYLIRRGDINKIKFFLSDETWLLRIWQLVHNRMLVNFQVNICLIEARSIIMNMKDTKGDTPLLIAAEHRQDDIFNYFLTLGGFNINEQDQNGNTCLHLINQNNNNELIHFLLDYPGIDIKIKNKENQLYHQTKKHTENVVISYENANRCKICFNSYTSENVIKLPCGHKFCEKHSASIYKRARCPDCRRNVVKRHRNTESVAITELTESVAITESTESVAITESNESVFTISKRRRS